jgi:hypothetical protein
MAKPLPTRTKLTGYQRRVLERIDHEGGPVLYVHLWQDVTTGSGRGLPKVLRNLERAGLVKSIPWWTDDEGPDYAITERGLAALGKLASS